MKNSMANHLSAYYHQVLLSRLSACLEMQGEPKFPPECKIFVRTADMTTKSSLFWGIGGHPAQPLYKRLALETQKQ